MTHFKKRQLCFIFLFPECDNLHLMKEIGLFPYYLNKFYGINAKVLTYKRGDYPYLDLELRGLNVDFLINTSYKVFKMHLSIVIYLLRNAKSIDFFTVKTLTRENLLYIYI